MKKPRREPLLARVMRKVSMDAQTGCWIWRGLLDAGGYGTQSVDGKNYKAHRVCWELHRGPIPAGMYACHRCDVRRCVNPDHIFLGTKADNNADMVNKGRNVTPIGERHGLAKLTPDAVRSIRCSPLGQRVLAKLHGVTPNAIYLARARLTWRHVL